MEAIRDNCDLNVICIVGKDDVSQNNFIKALQTLQKKLPTGDYAQFYRGTLKDNDVLEMEDSIIIFGDVKQILLSTTLIQERYISIKVI